MTGEDPPFRKRKRQHVVDKKTKAKVVKWIVETNESEGPKGLKAKAVKAFPGAFRRNTISNLAKASDWWKKRDLNLKADPGDLRYITPSQLGLRRQSPLKAAPSRGPKRAPCVATL